jgi:uncharacterized caspase-like protein
MSFLLWIGLCCLQLCASILPAAAQADGKKIALIVGVDKYDVAGLQSLNYAEADAKSIKDSLAAKGLV